MTRRSTSDLVRPTPHVLRQYALIADGERGALVGPRGDIAFLCAPRLARRRGVLQPARRTRRLRRQPADDRFVWGGYYEPDSLIWRSRWVSTDAVTECREALAFPGEPERVVLLRRIEATLNVAHVQVALDVRAEFGARAMTVARSQDGHWHGHSGDLNYRWTGATEHAQLQDGRLVLDLVVPAGESRDLVLEISKTALPRQLPDPDQLWDRTERAWRHGVPDLSTSVATGESRHSYAVLRGLTGSTGAMVAAATTSLPERADQGRNYDYRYAWIRDQCYAGQAAAAIGDHTLLDGAVRFVSERVLTDGPDLRPAYTAAGGPVPDQTKRSPCPDTPAHLCGPATGSTTSSSSTHSVKRCCSSRPRMAAADSPTTAARRSRPWSRRSGNERTNPTPASGRSTTAAGPTHDSCAPPGSAPRPPPAPRTRETPSPGADRPTSWSPR